LQRHENRRSARLAALLAAVIEAQRGDLSGPALAARAGMSERTFARAFRRETGAAPSSRRRA